MHHCVLVLMQGAVLDCNRVIDYDRNNIKALYRKALASHRIGKYAEALGVVDQLLQLQLPNDLQAIILKLKREIREFNKKDEMVKHSDGVPVSFVTEHQFIKLCIACAHIDTMIVDRAYSLQLCLGTEFGLFNKQLLPKERPMKIITTVIGIEEFSDVASTQIKNSVRIEEVGTAKFIDIGKVSYLLCCKHVVVLDCCQLLFIDKLYIQNKNYKH